ncbi:hypothetical protein Peur_024846 [Populus x canadensis]
MVRRNHLGGRNQDLNPEIAADSIVASPAYVSKDVIVPESLLSIQAGLVLINVNLDSPLQGQRSASHPFEKDGLDLGSRAGPTVCRGRREMKRFVNGGSLHGSVDVASEDSMTSAIERFNHRLLANYDQAAQERLADSEEISNMILVGN